MLHRLLRCSLFVLPLLAAACGGGGSNRTPAPSPVVPAPTPPPPDQWSVEGTVTTNLTGVPLSGAEVSAQGVTSVTTNAAGRFQLSGVTSPGSSSFRVSVTAPGHVNRDVWVKWQRGARANVDVNLIPNRAPFSLPFYRAFVRGGYESPDDLLAVRRWMNAPSFYVRTTDENGKAIEAPVITLITGSIRKAVREFSGGRYEASVQTGASARAQRTGWVNVNVVRKTDQGRNVCGYAFVGSNPGSITLVYDQCSCGSTKISGAVVMHEVGHAMGFFHVGDQNSLMFPYVPNRCPPGTLSAAELHHAKVAYSRPRGNLDPDRDPSSAAFAMPHIQIIN